METQKSRTLIGRIDARAAVLAAATIAIQCITYWLAQFIIKAAGLALHSPETPLDAHIPFLPIFLVPYVGCFAHWVITFYLIYRTKDGFARLFTAAASGYVIAAAVFIIWPTTITRPVGQAEGVLGFIYGIICATDAPLNLFPSVHCLVSYLCMAAAVKDGGIPKWYAWLSAVMFVLVCMATVFVKQHFIADVIGGTALGALLWGVAPRVKMRAWAARLYDGLKLENGRKKRPIL